MKVFPSIHLLVFTLLTGAALCACGVNETASPPPPTVTAQAAVPATATQPFTADGIPTNVGKTMPPEILDAFKKNRALEHVRYTITSEISFMQNGAPVHQPGLNAQGEESGGNRHLIISGIMNTTGEVASFEFITLDGATYIKGLSGIPGINRTQWYKFPPELGNVTRDAPSVKTLLAEIQLNDLKQAEFHQVGTETLDGHECTIWLAQDPKLAEGFIGIANSSQAEAQLSVLDSGEFRVWTCTDGYMHRLRGSLQGHASGNPADKATMELTFALFDHDRPIAITAPPDAQDFQVPVQETNTTPSP